MNEYPKQTGLYDPRHEHDACGIGAVVNISGKADHSIIVRAREVLMNLQHRGAAGSDESTGDGAGILLTAPHDFFAAEASRLGFSLPGAGEYAVAMVFCPWDDKLRGETLAILRQAIAHYEMDVIGQRDVPTDSSCLGDLARGSEPCIVQLFINSRGLRGEAFERKLYMARKRAQRLIAQMLPETPQALYVCSMSCRTIVYKGMFLAPQLFAYYPDLMDERVKSPLAIVHQRYSTNTFPSWSLAQPFRMIAHNGEINTLSGNRNQMAAREMSLASELLGDDLTDVLPVLTPGGSDSACFDNALELLVRAGRSLSHSMMMLIPEAFGANYHISTDKRAFYEYHSAIMEPWDGPAAMLFTDGKVVGGTLDRNGLRPARYVVTVDGLVVISSEAGVIEFDPENIKHKGRLQPGKMFLVDTEAGRLILDNEIKSMTARSQPYRRWLEENRIELHNLLGAPARHERHHEELTRQLRAFGYTAEDLEVIIGCMARDGHEPLGSMGADTPLAVLSDRPRLLFDYFKQLFAQVTNPPIDPYREGLVMSLMSYTGKQRNLLEEGPGHCRQLKLPHPILTNDNMERLKAAHRADFKVAIVDALFDARADKPGKALERGLDDLLDSCRKAIADGASLLVLSDRNADEGRAAIPSLLAVSAVHHGLLSLRLRGEAGLVVESGEPREVMHFCLLCGFGANAINPYLAMDAISLLRGRGDLSFDVDLDQYVSRYVAAVKKGILKTMSKMGISTLRSYHAAQLFEAVGLDSSFVDKYFTNTISRIGGVGIDAVASEAVAKHSSAFVQGQPRNTLDFGGEYAWRRDGERHLWNPQTVSLLQQAVRTNDERLYMQYAKLINDQSRELSTLRGLFEFKNARPAPIEEVEQAEQIVKRFVTGAMSMGSISKEAHETVAIAMNRLGACSNTGEGGEDPQRYRPGVRDDLNSAIKQVASGRFGVTIEYLANARELQIKMAQGAKPGEGGQLAGLKVTEDIARLRHSMPGVTLISPPPHHDIYSIEDLAQLIHDLKCASPGVKVSVKLVSEAGVGTVAAGVAKGNADEVLISGYDGGTGNSPLSSIKHAGAPWELGLAETQQTLILNGLRDRIVVQADGQMKTGRDVVVAALLGAERFGFGTAALVSLGCVLMRKCHHGACPAGIATQDPRLRSRFAGKPEHLQSFLLFVAQEVRRIMAELGFRRFEDMIGKSDRLSMRAAVDHYKARGLDFGRLLKKVEPQSGKSCRCTGRHEKDLSDHLDWRIIEQAGDVVVTGGRTVVELPIRNVHRTVGAVLSNHIVKLRGPGGLADGTLEVVLRGTAGQSFGAFLAPGVTLRLIGDANDYVGKGLCGGRIVVQAPPTALFNAGENIIAGNTLLYGATSGEAFINGIVGERFAVRNSGATAVVEGVGDHGCEYMTGGTVVILGSTGRNFAAGMSGGVAYVLDEHQLLDTLCNLDMVELESVWRQDDQDLLHRLLEAHAHWTGSRQARRVLDNWPAVTGRFVKIVPTEYRIALERKHADESKRPTQPRQEAHHV
ncbi:MAG: glutamate synthase large subunit [Planctomycetes bacterium]|nr:glutamate synthase large subunit [Planctomycetota bacterium]